MDTMQSIPAGTPAPSAKKIPAVKSVVALIIVVVLLLAILFLFKSPANAPTQTPPAVTPATQNTQEPSGSASDEVSAIDKDLNATDVNNLDAGLSDINQEVQ